MLRLGERRRHEIQLSFSFLLLCITCISGSAPFVHAGESQYGRSMSKSVTSPSQENTSQQNKWEEAPIVSTSVTSPSQKEVEFLKRMAEQGDAETQANLGIKYFTGDGVPQDYQESFKWCEKAAKSGHVHAQFLIGWMYNKGRGTEQDFKEALRWLHQAAEQGHVLAPRSLGWMYSQGKGTSQDYQEAIKWYRKAAEQGDADSQCKLGLMYDLGEGVSQDYQEAIKWYRKAAEQGDAYAQFSLGMMYYNGEGVSQDYQEAVKWCRKAAEQGLAWAQGYLGFMYDQGQGVPEDYQEAAKWYRKAAEQGHTLAQHSLGKMYADGKGVPQDYVNAYLWINLASAQETEYVVERDALAQRMTPEQIAEAQRLSSDFVARTERAVSGDSDTELSPNTTAFSENVPTGNGTAFAISSSGYLLTSAHVVQGASRIELYGNGNTHNAQVIKADTANDIALLQAEGTFTALPIASSGGTTLGTEVFTIGFPNVGIQGLSPKLTKGEISSLAGVQDDPRYFQISIPVQPGNSGGPLVDMQGRVIGIIAAIMNQEVALETTGTLAQNVNYAVKSSYILPLLESVPGLSDEVASDGRSNSLSTEEAIARAEKATFLLVTY